MPISRWLSQNLGESSLASAALGLQQKGISSPSSTRPGHGIPLCGVPRLANFKLLWLGRGEGTLRYIVPHPHPYNFPSLPLPLPPLSLSPSLSLSLPPSLPLSLSLSPTGILVKNGCPTCEDYGKSLKTSPYVCCQKALANHHIFVQAHVILLWSYHMLLENRYKTATPGHLAVAQKLVRMPPLNCRFFETSFGVPIILNSGNAHLEIVPELGPPPKYAGVILQLRVRANSSSLKSQAKYLCSFSVLIQLIPLRSQRAFEIIKCPWLWSCRYPCASIPKA